MKTFCQKKWYFFVPLVLVGVVVIGFVTMWLWNALMPGIFHLPVITFCQALGLLILTRLLFGGMGGHGRHHPMKRDLHNKWMNMTPEEREQFRNNMHQHSWFGHSCNRDDENRTESANTSAK